MSISIENLGFVLTPVQTRDGSRLLSLETPFRWVNGDSLDVFVEQVGDTFHVFDDGLSLHEIAACGVDLSKNFAWNTLHLIAAERNVRLTQSGIFEVTTSLDNAQEAVANFLRTMLAVNEWLIELSSTEPDA